MPAAEEGEPARMSEMEAGGIREICAFELEGRVGAPHADVGLGVGMQVIDGREELRRGARGGGEDLTVVGDVGCAGVRDGEVELAGFGAYGHLVVDVAHGFGAIFTGEGDVELDFFAGAHVVARGGDVVNGELLLLVEGLDVEGDLFESQGIETALHDEGDGDRSGERSEHGRTVIGGVHVIDAQRGGGVLKIDLAGDANGGCADGPLGGVDGAEDGHLEEEGESRVSLTICIR
jgi:hypothetical protein